eukprot:CAMPEP_0185421970 /NCGR_PEP_ID=MMETSP1365-20130426/11411_1 /TAXON_ID=38817 /ORGANISM="Gephyrocapsa oceanica, Strain RCC1303" /LENGTH=50 /DNA_ID=CAMNT_0028025739 /DNA_START=64 /DNA_END=213 /DNA_ORIENTATION=+
MTVLVVATPVISLPSASTSTPFCVISPVMIAILLMALQAITSTTTASAAS